jgi:predicted ABC-type ATPase
MPRPVLFVLAGVNGAGKSSIGGHILKQAGMTWFDPDAFARELRAATGCTSEAANGQAWAESVRRLDDAVVARRHHAMETTLGGRTVAQRIRGAAKTHDVLMWFCGLSSPETHIGRVRARVAAGGHDIPEATIRERYPRAIRNLIALLPHLAQLHVYDNSAEVASGESVPDPVLLIEMKRGRLVRPSPRDGLALSAMPNWAKPIVEAALAG